jgi:hypothetical protein
MFKLLEKKLKLPLIVSGFVVFTDDSKVALFVLTSSFGVSFFIMLRLPPATSQPVVELVIFVIFD